MPRIPVTLKRFAKDEAGVISVETVIIFPLLLWAFAAMFVFFDAFKAQNTNIKATYTVADLISRSTDPLDEDYINGMKNIHAFLNRGTANNDIRVTVVTRQIGTDGITEENAIIWSYATGAMVHHTDVSLLNSKIPMMSVGDQTIIVQTRTDWTPLMRFGLDARTLRDTAITSPRFVPQVVWAGADPAGGSGSSSPTATAAVSPTEPTAPAAATAATN